MPFSPLWSSSSSSAAERSYSASRFGAGPLQDDKIVNITALGIMDVADS
jgi:hypothetical protein